jgi:sugar transferase (PEP-CTERM/EpsH1 system associated)
MSFPVTVRAGGGERTAAADLSATAWSERTGVKTEPPIHILHILDRLDVGGTEKGIAKLIGGLDPDLFQHSICTLRGTAPVACSWMPGIKVTDVGSGTHGFQFNVLRLASAIKTIRPTIVHSRNWGGIEALFAARSAGVPVIMHSEHGYQLDMKHGLPLRQRILRHVAYRCADAVFTVSQELRDFHAAQAWWNVNSIGVVHNGVDGDTFRPSLEVSGRIRQEVGIPRDALVVGFVGRLVALKDVKTLLLGLEGLVSNIPEVHAIIVGSGPELAPLRDYVARSAMLRGRICFTGPREDVADLLKAMDIFVLPSLMEGMSNTILEAMSTGLPVIATNVGGNPEILADSACGYLFHPGNVAELQTHLATLLLNEEQRKEFGQEARRRALTTFSLEAMLRQYHQLYLELATVHSGIESARSYVRN